MSSQSNDHGDFYENRWRSVLRNVLHWPTDKIDEWIAHMQTKMDKDTWILHEHPEWYLAPLFVDDVLALFLRSKTALRLLEKIARVLIANRDAISVGTPETCSAILVSVNRVIQEHANETDANS